MSGFNLVTHAAYRLNEWVREALVNLVAQVVDVNIYDIGEGFQVVTPNRIDDLCTCEYLPRMAHQVLQQGKFLSGELNDAPIAACFVAHQIEGQVSHRELGSFIKTTI